MLKDSFPLVWMSPKGAGHPVCLMRDYGAYLGERFVLLGKLQPAEDLNDLPSLNAAKYYC